jgi:Rad52/22 family double-strand break repair protein
MAPGEVHDIALKAAETDATKRALATFGKPFGLELYSGGKAKTQQKPLPSPVASGTNQARQVPDHHDHASAIVAGNTSVGLLEGELPDAPLTFTAAEACDKFGASRTSTASPETLTTRRSILP